MKKHNLIWLFMLVMIVAQITLVWLKVFEVISWSWIVVLLPLIIWFTLDIILCIVVWIIHLLQTKYNKKF